MIRPYGIRAFAVKVNPKRQRPGRLYWRNPARCSGVRLAGDMRRKIGGETVFAQECAIGGDALDDLAVS